MGHFTYSESKDHHLCQGDILKKTDKLIRVLSEVHPYFQRDEYEYFMVLTQSCDLVRRSSSQCKSKYITLCAVRSFENYLQREIKEKQMHKAEKGSICDSRHKQHFSELLARLFNNNEPEYFFLASDYEADFPKDCVAYLRVSIALKSMEHYDECLEAKLIEMDSTFQAKIGWLIGNMYSRVGTPDWAPEHITDQKFIEKIANTLDQNITWLEPDVLSELSHLPEIEELTEEQIEERAKIVAPKKNKKQRLLGQLEIILGYEQLGINQVTKKKVLQYIQNDPQIASLFPSR